MTNKTILITGATSGIGKEEALALAAMGHTIVMLVRNETKALSVKNEIIASTGNKDIDSFIFDLSSMEEVRSVSQKIKLKYPVIDVLINNAGMIYPERKVSPDGYELTFALNHLGHFLLTNLLMENIIAAPQGRIINLSSEAHKFGTMNFDDINLEKGYGSMKAYGQSKLANLLFTFELQRRLAGTNVTVNAVHPGVVKTNFGNEYKGLVALMMKLVRPFMRNARKGAETVVWLASGPEAAELRGKYFKDKKAIASTKESRNIEKSKLLWDVSEEMTGIKSNLNH